MFPDYTYTIDEYLKTLDYNVLIRRFPKMVAYTLHVIMQEAIATFEEVKNMDLSEYNNTFTVDIPYELFDEDKIFFSNEVYYNKWQVVVTLEDRYKDHEIDYDRHNYIRNYQIVNGKITGIIMFGDLFTSQDQFLKKYSEIIFYLVNDAYMTWLLENV